jgi:UPF0716 protein FxsA
MTCADLPPIGVLRFFHLSILEMPEFAGVHIPGPYCAAVCPREFKTMRPFLILFIVLPILEMWVLITVGEKIGALPTIGLVLLTAVVGLALLRRQGISTLMRAQEKMRAGEVPAKEMAEGIFLAVGGALLLTPGFITDTLGFICLIPGLRQLVLGKLLSRIVVVQPGYGPRPGGQEQGSGNVIEGDYQREGQDRNPRNESRDGSSKGDR